ncbi:MAG: response regulator transcription factor [Alphaproteobacteria bacterium]|nr:response regulator transcription factor [Alphaproteobacteria bacterium]
MRILVIEDSAELQRYIVKGLKECGHVVDCADNGKEGLYLATTGSYDAVVVDRMIPPPDGLTIIRSLRGAGNNVPTLVLSALGEVDDRVNGLRAGADDYLVKPFAFTELLARLEALIRRTSIEATPPTSRLEAGDLVMDLLTRKVWRGGEEISLQSREFRLLEYLMRHKGQVVTRTMLLEKVWEYHFDPQTNVIDVHISRLRNKVDKGFDHPLIQTVRGAGYILAEG